VNPRFLTIYRRSGPLARAAFALLAVLLPLLALRLIGVPGGVASAQVTTPPAEVAGQTPTPQAAPAAQFSVYLPITARSRSQTTPVTPTPVTPTPVTPTPVTKGAFFATTELSTNSAGAIVDADGGMHMAFAFFLSASDDPPAVYAFCTVKPASACADSGKWQAVSLSYDVNEVQLALTPDGKPRLLIRKERDGHNHDEYVYAACDSGCANQEQWQLASITFAGGVDVFGKDNPQHNFGLDNLGRPRFVYSNGWGAGYPVGVYYAYCDDACTDSGSWSKTQIYEGPEFKSLSFDYPSLTFTRDGQPRVVANVAFSGETQGVRYLACDSGCGDIAGWESVLLYPRGGGVSASWDIELDSADRPRIAFYQAGFEDGSGDRLFYVWCNADCLSEASWQRAALTGVGDGKNADLELDGQNRPRIAFNSGTTTGVGYLWCNTGCESVGATWKRGMAEPASQLQQEFAVPYPGDHCDPSVWAEMIPSLALDAQGNPRIAYDALNVSRCYYDDDFDPTTPPVSKIEYLWRAARWVFFNQPS
jgi:hypothetical protein